MNERRRKEVVFVEAKYLKIIWDIHKFNLELIIAMLFAQNSCACGCVTIFIIIIITIINIIIIILLFVIVVVVTVAVVIIIVAVDKNLVSLLHGPAVHPAAGGLHSHSSKR